MTFDPPKILQSKREFRQRLATRPIEEKLAMLDALRERTLAIRRVYSAPDPVALRETPPPCPRAWGQIRMKTQWASCLGPKVMAVRFALWRKKLHFDFEHVLAETKLPERREYEAANRFVTNALWDGTRKAHAP
jgi:hypothetical protein